MSSEALEPITLASTEYYREWLKKVAEEAKQAGVVDEAMNYLERLYQIGERH